MGLPLPLVKVKLLFYLPVDMKMKTINNPTSTITNWYYSPFTNCIHGVISNDSRFSDGTPVKTSRVEMFCCDRTKAVTQNTIYNLVNEIKWE